MAGLVVFGAAAAPEPCPVVCVQGGYITCDNYPYQKLDGCACECAPKDGVNCVGSGWSLASSPAHAARGFYVAFVIV
jgi:hypothetical protein